MNVQNMKSTMQNCRPAQGMKLLSGSFAGHLGCCVTFQCRKHGDSRYVVEKRLGDVRIDHQGNMDGLGLGRASTRERRCAPLSFFIPILSFGFLLSSSARALCLSIAIARVLIPLSAGQHALHRLPLASCARDAITTFTASPYDYVPRFQGAACRLKAPPRNL